MTAWEDRQQLAVLIEEARSQGSRLAPACQAVGIDVRTYQRWRHEGSIVADRRPTALRPRPANALSATERQRILAVANSPRFAERPPSQIVPCLADEGCYLASEATIYRILRQERQHSHRGRTKARKPRPVSTHVATGPNHVWCWDVTYLPATLRGTWFYLYFILDIYSRKIVGWSVEENESSDHAARLLEHTAAEERIAERLVLHSDNGSVFKASTLRSMMSLLGIYPSYSRPRVSNDNPFVESVFRTAKYHPKFPEKPFASIHEARIWGDSFVTWYNTEHRHSSIGFVTPQKRHPGHDVGILAARDLVYQAARTAHPERWSRHTRTWQPTGSVPLNPEQERPIGALTQHNPHQLVA